MNLPKVLSHFEKLFVSGLLLIVLVIGFLWWQDVVGNWAVKPVKGGTYAEGILQANIQDLVLVTAKLTKIGLTYVDHANELHGALAEHWEISDGGKKYTFYLRSGLDAMAIAETYSGLAAWQNITITPLGNTITMVLKQPFSPLLAFASDPVVDLGPYKIEKSTKSETIFIANKDFVLGEPNIERIILTLYPDEKTLKAAIQRQEIMGADQPIKSITGTHMTKLKLTKQSVLLFNLERPTFKDRVTREKIKSNKKLDSPVKATLVTTQEPELLAISNDFARQVEKLGLQVSIRSVNPITLERDILPRDEYDLLVTTINYGYDQDPYPFWHSSQVIEPGKNYAGYNSKEADKLIEEARQALDPVERQKKYAQFETILNQDIPGIFFPNQEFRYTVSNRLKGLTEGVGAVPADRYSEAWKWYLKSKKTKG